MTKTERSAERRALAFGLLLVAFLAANLLVASPAHARTFVVDTTADLPDANLDDDACIVSILGGCTLRAAMQQANATAGPDTIDFNISGSGPHPIAPASALPQITEPVTIDGYSQPDSRRNTALAPQGSNAAPTIELDGTGAGDFVSGLLIESTAPNSVIRGLVINRCDANGIFVEPGGQGNRIEGNFIGTDPGGQLDLGNGGSGVVIGGLSGGNNTVGGATPEARNLISGNDGADSVAIASSGNKVEGNLVGTRKDGIGALGNSLNGVGIGYFGNTLGGADANTANVIAFNGEDGVRVINSTSTGNRILGNSIFGNGQLGIELDNNGRTPNDPGDPDAGPNNLQNFPVLDSATRSGGQLTVTGNLNSTPSTQIRRKKKKKKKKRTVFVPQVFTVQFFSNPSVENEGKTLIGETTVVTSLTGDAPINLTFTPSRTVSAGERITATATRNSTGDTSEFSDPREVV